MSKFGHTYCFFYFAIAIFIFNIAVLSLSEDIVGDGRLKSISSAQFCGGCKLTVELLGKLASEGIKKMEKEKADRRDSLDVTKLSDGLCSRKEFERFHPFVTDSCIKIMNDHKYHFLNVFAGEQTTLFSSIKGNLFRAKKAACVNETNACPPQVFTSEKPSAKHRTKCNACHEIAKDIESTKFVLKPPARNVDIVENVCQDLASNHLPYSWIETYCEEIFDEYTEEIVATLDRRDILKLNPHTSPFSRIVCGDILNCPELPYLEPEL